MARKIQVKRGLKKDLPVLSTGEFAFVRDTKEVVIGGEGENIGLAKASDVQAVATQVAGKASADSVTALTSQLAETAKRIIQTGNAVKTFAHRGDEALAPENTLKAFELAKQANYDGVELDVSFSSDGKAMVHHDDELNRMTNGEGLFNSKTYAEIQNFTIDAGNFVSWHTGLKVPTLEESLILCKKLKLEVIVELKTFSDSEIITVENLISKLGMYETTYILAPYGIANRLETMKSNLRAMIFFADHADFRIAMMKPNVVSVGIYPDSTVTQAIIDEIRQQGLLVNVATVITHERARTLAAMGVDLITGGVSIV